MPLEKILGGDTVGEAFCKTNLCIDAVPVSGEYVASSGEVRIERFDTTNFALALPTYKDQVLKGKVEFDAASGPGVWNLVGVVYNLMNVTHNFGSSVINFDAGDATFDRIDTVFLLADGTYRVGKGTATPVSVPQEPLNDELAYVLFRVPANWTDQSEITLYGYSEILNSSVIASEIDPTVEAHIKAITATQISNWDSAFGWGDHSLAGYALTSSLGTMAFQDANNVAITGGSLTGVTLSASSMTNTSLTATHIIYAGIGGVLSGSANLTWNNVTGSLAAKSVGSGTTNYTIITQNGSSVTTFGVRDDGLWVGANGNLQIFRGNANAANPAAPNLNGASNVYYNAAASGSATAHYFRTAGFTSSTAGSEVLVRLHQNFTPTSGNANATWLYAAPDIGQTGGANGITRIAHFVPSIQSATDLRIIEVDTGISTHIGYKQTGANGRNVFEGKVWIGGDTPISSATRLYVKGTTSNLSNNIIEVTKADTTNVFRVLDNGRVEMQSLTWIPSTGGLGANVDTFRLSGIHNILITKSAVYQGLGAFLGIASVPVQTTVTSGGDNTARVILAPMLDNRSEGLLNYIGVAVEGTIAQTGTTSGNVYAFRAANVVSGVASTYYAYHTNNNAITGDKSWAFYSSGTARSLFTGETVHLAGIRIGGSTGTAPTITYSGGVTTLRQLGGGAWTVQGQSQSASVAGQHVLAVTSTGPTGSTGSSINVDVLRIEMNDSRATGELAYSGIRVFGVINNTSTTGTQRLRGIYVNTTLTNTGAVGWASVETANNTGFAFYAAGAAPSHFGGAILIGSTSQVGSEKLRVNGTSYFDGAITSDGPVILGRLASAPSSPLNGTIYYDTTLNKFRGYSGVWVDFH